VLTDLAILGVQVRFHGLQEEPLRCAAHCGVAAARPAWLKFQLGQSA
jgi:hypothetical protein